MFFNLFNFMFMFFVQLIVLLLLSVVYFCLMNSHWHTDIEWDNEIVA